MIQTNNTRQGVLKMVSEFYPSGLIGLGLVNTQSILLEIRLGNRPDNFVELLPVFKLKWGQAHANKYVGVHIILQETPQVRFTLEGIQHQAEYRLLDVSKIIFGPKIALLRL